MVLEPPSDATLQAKETVGHVWRYLKDPLLKLLCQNEEEKLHANRTDLALLGPSAHEQPKRRRKGIKGPNPLSVKKKKTQPATAPQQHESELKGHVGSHTASAGMKRRAEYDAKDQEEGSDGAGVDNETPSSKRKRKRRKKT